MLQISVDATVLSQSQREAIASFMLSFPPTASELDDPIISCPIMEVDPSSWTAEERAETKSDPISEEQLKEINRIMRLIDGEPTLKQIEEAFRSVMTPS